MEDKCCWPHDSDTGLNYRACVCVWQDAKSCYWVAWKPTEGLAKYFDQEVIEITTGKKRCREV